MITIAEYAEFANKTLPLKNEAQVEALIEMATEIIEKEIDRDLYACSPSPIDIVEVFDGNGNFRIWTKNAPIDSVETIEYWTGTEWQDVSELNMTFTWDETTGKVWFTERYTFHKGIDNWRITYNYGFTDDIPADLKYACFLLTKHFEDIQSRQGIRSQSDGEQSFTYAENMDVLWQTPFGFSSVSRDFTTIIAKYKRYR
jgi:hypothetical protein